MGAEARGHLCSTITYHLTVYRIYALCRVQARLPSVTPLAAGYELGAPFAALSDLTLVDHLEEIRPSLDDSTLEQLDAFALSVAQVRALRGG